jgi:hypothetical protein
MPAFAAHSQWLLSIHHEIIVAVMTQQLSIDKGSAAGAAGGPWMVLAAAMCSVARVELRRYALPSPNEMWELDDAPILSFVMPRAEGTQGEIMFDLGDRRRHKVGRLLLRPGGIAMHSRGDGGVLDILACRFDPVRFAAVTGLDEWDSRRLSHCASINSPILMTLAERLKQEVVAPGFGSDMAVEAVVQLMMVEVARAGRIGAVAIGPDRRCAAVERRPMAYDAGARQPVRDKPFASVPQLCDDGGDSAVRSCVRDPAGTGTGHDPWRNVADEPNCGNARLCHGQYLQCGFSAGHGADAAGISAGVSLGRSHTMSPFPAVRQTKWQRVLGVRERD